MVDATAQNVGVEHATDGAVATEEAFAVAHAGAVSFPELVRAHYEWERGGCVEGPAEDHYRRLLKRCSRRRKASWSIPTGRPNGRRPSR